jgi:hypothetical protein
MSKLKESNDILEKILHSSLNELSTEYSKQAGVTHVFDFWHNVRQYDKDKNQCSIFVMDVRATVPNEDKTKEDKVVSFKRLYDKMIIQRPNIGTVENPKYGKQQNFEESRNAVLREIFGKSVAGLAMGLAVRSKEEIQDFNKIVDAPITPDEAFDIMLQQNQFGLTEEDRAAFVEDYKREVVV